MSAVFEKFAAEIVARNDDNLCDYGPEEQTARAVKALEKFAAHTGIMLATEGHMIDLAGFGSAPVHFENENNRYLLLSEVATALGMPVWEACKWASKEQLHAIRDQREHDEERGEGRLGWELLDDYCDLNLWLVTEIPGTTKDGRPLHSDFSDWLISHDRLMLFILDSPWGKEFMANTGDLFAHGMKKAFGDKLKDMPAVRIHNGEATPATGEDLFHSDLSEEEARRKARRGPNIPMEEQ